MPGYIVIALDDEGGPVAIGPVFNDASVDRIRDQIDATDSWENQGTARKLSVREFEQEISDNNRRTR